jgi:uncharacterized protein YabE (DUF348 family)
MGGTVGDVLDDEGIKIDRARHRRPGLDEKVADGSRITVRFGRPLQLSVDGHAKTYWVTSTNVDDALGRDRPPLPRRRPLRQPWCLHRPHRHDPEVVTPKNAHVKIGREAATKKEVAALTVADVLEELSANVDKNDIVKPALDARGRGRHVVVTVTKVRVVTKNVDGEVDPTSHREAARLLDVRGRGEDRGRPSTACAT